jgi:hypothetical protein
LENSFLELFALPTLGLLFSWGFQPSMGAWGFSCFWNKNLPV